MAFELFDYAETHGFGEVHMKVDQETGLRAIIAIHSTKLGPALGGCRCLVYPDTQAALYDAMRLARAMSYKAALVRIPHGGGKSVLMKPAVIKDRKAYFKAFGHFLNSLQGQYITAIDSGSSVEDMDIIGSVTPYVTSLSTMDGETSLFTAKGVLRGIEAAVKYYLKRSTLQDIHVAVQGVGHVGYFLVRLLTEAGAKVTISDVNTAAVEACAKEYKVQTVAPEKIYDVECDVFSPCALGAVINDDTLKRLKTTIIAGSANNQLARSHHGKAAFDRGIHYLPDYVINSGGLIYAAGEYDKVSEQEIHQKIDHISDSLTTIFERSTQQSKPTSEIADKMAEEILY